MSKYKEGKVEQYLVQQVEERGGKAYKWVSPGCRGVPDRIVVLPGTPPFFVEVKAPGERLSPQQESIHRELLALGSTPEVVDCNGQVDALLELWDASYAYS